MQQFYFFRPQGFIGCFQNQRHVIEPWVAHEALEKVHAQQSLADAVVAVHARGEWLFGIIQVHGAQVMCSDGLVKLFPGLLVTLFRLQIIAGGVGVAGVDADPHAVFVFYLVDDKGDMLEAEAHIAALPGGVLNYSGNVMCLVQCHVDALRDAPEAIFERNLVEVAARVEVQHVQTQLLAAFHLIEKGIARFLQRLFFGLPKVDEVAVVRQDEVGCDAGLPAIGLEGVNGFCRQRRRHPLPLVLGEQGKGGCANGHGIQRGVFHAAGSTDVRSYVFHN